MADKTKHHWDDGWRLVDARRWKGSQPPFSYSTQYTSPIILLYYLLSGQTAFIVVNKKKGRGGRSPPPTYTQVIWQQMRPLCFDVQPHPAATAVVSSIVASTWRQECRRREDIVLPSTLDVRMGQKTMSSFSPSSCWYLVRGPRARKVIGPHTSTNIQSWRSRDMSAINFMLLKLYHQYSDSGFGPHTAISSSSRHFSDSSTFWIYMRAHKKSHSHT